MRGRGGTLMIAFLPTGRGAALLWPAAAAP